MKELARLIGYCVLMTGSALVITYALVSLAMWIGV